MATPKFIIFKLIEGRINVLKSYLPENRLLKASIADKLYTYKLLQFLFSASQVDYIWRLLIKYKVISSTVLEINPLHNDWLL